MYIGLLGNIATLLITGTTGEHIVLVGDSAGGNLSIATAMKILEMGMNIYMYIKL